MEGGGVWKVWGKEDLIVASRKPLCEMGRYTEGHTKQIAVCPFQPTFISSDAG